MPIDKYFSASLDLLDYCLYMPSQPRNMTLRFFKNLKHLAFLRLG